MLAPLRLKLAANLHWILNMVEPVLFIITADMADLVLTYNKDFKNC